MIQGRPVSANDLASLRWLKYFLSDIFLADQPKGRHSICTHVINESTGYFYGIGAFKLPTFGEMLTCDFQQGYHVGEFDASMFDMLVVSPGWLTTKSYGNYQNIALSLREVSGLPVAALARLVGVSRQAYHSWLLGSPISSTKTQRLSKLLTILNYARERRPDVSAFMAESTIAGNPMTLLEEGRDDVVLGLLALRPSTYLPTSRGAVRSLGFELTPERLADAKAVTSFAPPLADDEALPEDFFVAIGCIEFS
jgi:hypothetical protein